MDNKTSCFQEIVLMHDFVIRGNFIFMVMNTNFSKKGVNIKMKFNVIKTVDNISFNPK